METGFNIDAACQELKIGREVYLRIVKRAFEQTKGDLVRLREAHAAHDVADIQAVAHRLKGDYANLRMKALSAVAAELNALAKAEYEAAKALELIERFHVLFDEMRLMIEGPA